MGQNVTEDQTWGTVHVIQLPLNTSCSLLYRLGSLGDDLLPTTGLGVVCGIVEMVYSKCILAVLLSLMNVVVMTTTVKLYPAGTTLKVGESS